MIAGKLLMVRRCDFCETPLSGKGHGFPVGGMISCGRTETQKTIRDRDGKPLLKRVALACGGSVGYTRERGARRSEPRASVVRERRHP